MTPETKQKIADALNGSQIGAIVACALGVEMPNPRFTSKAIITSDGFVQANFVDGQGISRHSAFVGSYDELQENLRSVQKFLQFKGILPLGPLDDNELSKAVLTDWIATDYRSVRPATSFEKAQRDYEDGNN